MARLVRMAGGIVDGRTLGAPPMPQTEQELTAVAHSQRGLLTRQQCLSAGMSDRAIRWRLVKGRWTCVHHGVYLTTPERDDWYTTALAAQLAVSDSAWSHRTAAHVHGLIRESPAIIELVVDRERRVAEPAGTKLHRRVSVNRAVDELHWPWRTTVEETILDVSRKGSSDELMAMLGRAFQRSRTSEASLRAALATRRAHPWRELLELILAEVADGAESAMEVRYLHDVERAHDLPIGRRQRRSVTGGRERHDVAYDEQRVLVELDGRLGHEGFEAQRKDGRRDRRGAGSGWLSARAYWDDVALTPCQLAVEVGAILHSRGWENWPSPFGRRSCAVR
jgi:very-short-patch-repair endonuclease